LTNFADGSTSMPANISSIPCTSFANEEIQTKYHCSDVYGATQSWEAEGTGDGVELDQRWIE
jgi:hypothetical protein